MIDTEAARIQRLKQQMRDQERARFADPDANADLTKTWVTHLWVPDSTAPDRGEWLYVGTRRRRLRRKPQSMGRFFSRVRRQFGLDKKSPVMVMDANTARLRNEREDAAWRFRPPQFQQRRRKPMPMAPVVDRTKRKTRAKVKAFKLHKRDTKYIAIGRNPWDRQSGYLYLGPLHAEQKRAAQFEARRTFGVYTDLLVIGADELSKSLRNAMHRGKKVRAGVTRMAWPEVAPAFEDVWDKFAHRLHRKVCPICGPKDRGACAYRLNVDHVIADWMYLMWLTADRPWLTLGWFRKHLKQITPSSGDQTCGTRKARAKKSAKRKSLHSAAKSKRNGHVKVKSARVSKPNSPRKKWSTTRGTRKRAR
jgi:hypothetical protein